MRSIFQGIRKKSKNKQMGLKLVSFFRAKETINEIKYTAYGM